MFYIVSEKSVNLIGPLISVYDLVTLCTPTTNLHVCCAKYYYVLVFSSLRPLLCFGRFVKFFTPRCVVKRT